ncbi:hypothetical protein P280DRAFT_444768 [Massarina eburnea CBS 473.64]|uniref:RNA ligase domain-containing protein n=1 Tax=Massarina eburnea CBS 473.64 TaxID=1395130 RepID=A0A6A6S762_9PLEO|nr:hypothetical protein P280DRAFT_444768 [Massarina eburnea CBS 473.64]
MDTPLADTTLYPKITNHISEIVQALTWQLRDPENPEAEVKLNPIAIVGTVKLHGTHADILVGGDNKIILQSRNKTNLRVTADNYDFAKSMQSLDPTIIQLRDSFRERWKVLNPDETLDDSLPMTIAGEWIGEKIQKGVAIAKLSKRLVIISIKINGKWVADSDYKDIEAPDHGIYNISRAGIYHSILYAEDLQRTVNELELLADKVATQCPFAKSFGITGEGEGLVWKLVPYISDAQLWFKTKGGRFKPTFTPAPKKLSADQEEKRAFAATVAKLWCSELRLEQGWDYLREMNIPRSMQGIGPFLKWIQDDIFKEERGYIQEHEVAEGMLRIEIGKVAKPWFLERAKRGDE